MWNDFILNTKETIVDSKTKLQEFSLKKFKILPKYKLIKMKGLKHKPIFHVQVKIKTSQAIEGVGNSKKLAEQDAATSLLKNIVGVKDATGDLNRLDQTIKKLGSEFIQLTGEDGLAFEFNKRGGVGIISVTANIAPKLCSEMQNYSKSKSENEIKEAERIDQMLQPLHKSLFIESNPAPAKYAAKLLGLCSDEIRLPLVNIKDETKDKVKKALQSAKLIS